MHLLRGVATAATRYTIANPERREAMARRWSGQLLDILHVHPTIHGKLAPRPANGTMIIANHISWLDIFLIESTQPAHFVSKAEVRDWPLIGWLAKKIGTLFIERSRKRDTHRINDAIRNTLKNGGVVVVFPEGTTSDGRKIRPFHASLLQAGIDCGSLIQPVTIRYPLADGATNVAPAYIDDMDFADSLKRITDQKDIRAELTFLAPIASKGKTRRKLAIELEAAIASALHLANPHSGTGIPADPPALAR